MIIPQSISQRAKLKQSLSGSKSLQHLIKRRSVILKCSIVFLIYVLISDILFEDNLRRRLSCNNTLRKAKRLRSTFDRMMLTANETISDCETVFPTQEIVEVVGVNYYAPIDQDTGIYYPDIAEIPVTVPQETDDIALVIDPIVLVPDADEPVYYDPVDTVLLDTFTPQTYPPVPESEKLPAENTTAYAVVITSCPEMYTPPETEVTDPGTENIYEATALVKHSVCNATETTAIVRRLRRQLITEDTMTVTASDDYTM